MSYTYDDDNIFAKILRGEIPNDTVMETEHTLAFRDIRPQAPNHVLVIPKGKYVCHDHFCLEATEQEIVDFMRVSGQICADLGVQPFDGASGYRTISNAGADARQEVPHYHLHILAGRDMGPLLGAARLTLRPACAGLRPPAAGSARAGCCGCAWMSPCRR